MLSLQHQIPYNHSPEGHLTERICSNTDHLITSRPLGTRDEVDPPPPQPLLLLQVLALKPHTLEPGVSSGHHQLCSLEVK